MKFNPSQGMRLLAVGGCVLFLGCASTALFRSRQNETSSPEPGTRDYYEQKIKGAYAFHQGELIPIAGFRRVEAAGATRPLPPGLTRLGGTPMVPGAHWMDGQILQVLSNDLVVVGRTVTNVSGVVTYTRSSLVTLTCTPPVSKDETLRLLVVTDGSYQYKTSSRNGTLNACREVAEPTYEEYRGVFERDRQASNPDPIISFERNVMTMTRSGLIRPAAGAPAVSRQTTSSTVTAVTAQDSPGPAPHIITPALPPPSLLPGVSEQTGRPPILPRSYKERLLEQKQQQSPAQAETVSAQRKQLENLAREAAKKELAKRERLAQESAAPLQQDGYTFRTNAGGEAVILGFDKGYAGTLAITNSLGGCSVTGIDTRAFQNCAGLTDITIPSSITRIGEAAFEFCHGLTRVTVPATVTSMGGNPFGGCHRLLSVSVDAANPAYVSNADGILFTKDLAELVCYPASKTGDYVIPNGVARLGRGAFLFCPQLTRVVIPNSVTNIGDCVFFICPRLTQVVIPESVTRIGMQAFESCNGLTELTIPASVNHLVSWAFRGCGNLASIYFKGNAPGGGSDSSVFSGADKATIYYRPGTTGWGKEFGGRPTAEWKP